MSDLCYALRLVLRQGLSPVLAGIVTGTVLSAAGVADSAARDNDEHGQHGYAAESRWDR
jgi:hypothetical protein